MEYIYPDMTASEKEVAEYLKELGLTYMFESPIFLYDEKGRPRVWTPDFYIPKLGMHIEVCGSEKYDYEYRDRTYQNNGHHVIFIHAYKQEKQWKKFLLKKIMEIEEQRHDEVMKMIGNRIT